MTAPRIKATYTLDAETVELLEKLARVWRTSKSGALRRALMIAGSTEPALSPRADRSSRTRRKAHIDDRLAALRELQDGLELSERDAQQWVAKVREARRSWPDRRKP
jgi:hypothetical protein